MKINFIVYSFLLCLLPQWVHLDLYSPDFWSIWEPPKLTLATTKRTKIHKWLQWRQGGNHTSNETFHWTQIENNWLCFHWWLSKILAWYISKLGRISLGSVWCVIRDSCLIQMVLQTVLFALPRLLLLRWSISGSIPLSKNLELVFLQN